MGRSIEVEGLFGGVDSLEEMGGCIEVEGAFVGDDFLVR